MRHSEEAGMNDPSGENRKLSEIIEGGFGGQRSLGLLFLIRETRYK